MSGSTLVGIVLAAAVLYAAWRLLETWLRYRGDRVITCPENQRPAGVHVDVRHAAVTALTSDPHVRLNECTRWPEKQNCGQECLRELQNAPQDCLVRNILVRWYADQNCALCGKPIGDIGAAGAKPALLAENQVTLEWSAVAPERLQDTLATAKPVCFGCHMATTFARQHPELVTKRARPA